MRLGDINASTFRQSDPVGRQPEPDCAAPAPDSRALVVLAPNTDGSEGQAAYRNAAFLAHLIATKDQHPQTRERRRADPAEALAAYRATAALSQT
jgi:hypothetical protein